VLLTLQLIDGSLYGGSHDGPIKVGDNDTGALEKPIHTKPAVCIIAQLRNGRICSVHKRSIGVEIWNCNTSVSEMVLS
jgi:hypothetical protein